MGDENERENSVGSSFLPSFTSIKINLCQDFYFLRGGSEVSTTGGLSPGSLARRYQNQQRRPVPTTTFKATTWHRKFAPTARTCAIVKGTTLRLCAWRLFFSRTVGRAWGTNRRAHSNLRAKTTGCGPGVAVAHLTHARENFAQWPATFKLAASALSRAVWGVVLRPLSAWPTWRGRRHLRLRFG